MSSLQPPPYYSSQCMTLQGRWLLTAALFYACVSCYIIESYTPYLHIPLDKKGCRLNIFFLYVIICCVYSFGASNGYPQQKFAWRIEISIYKFWLKKDLIWSCTSVRIHWVSIVQEKEETTEQTPPSKKNAWASIVGTCYMYLIKQIMIS